MSENNNLISLEEAADLLHKSTLTIRRYIHNGLLHGYKPGTRATRVDRDEIMQLKYVIEHPTESPVGDIHLRRGEVLKLWYVPGHPEYNTSALYAVSNYGNVYNLTRRKTITQSYATHGYPQVELARGSTDDRITLRVHRMVALMFCANRLHKSDVHHLNGDVTDNRAINLLWVTSKQHHRLERLLRTIRNNSSDLVKHKKYDELVNNIKLENCCGKWLV